MQMTRLIALALLVVLVAPAQAQVQSAKGMATVTYRNKVTPEIKAQAYHDAQVKAIEGFVAEEGTSQGENFEVIRAKVAGAIDDYALGTTILSDNMREDLHQYSIVVRVDVNVARLRQDLKKSSTVANTADQQKSTLTFVFVARGQGEVQSFDTHTYKRSDVKTAADNSRDTSQTGSEGEQVHGSQVATSAGTSAHAAEQKTNSTVIESGGSTAVRADQVTWTMLPTGAFSAVIDKVFDVAGFDVVEAQDVPQLAGGPLKALKSDYATGNDPQPETWSNVIQGLRAAQIPYVALATLDVSVPRNDSQTGLRVVTVTVTGKFLSVTGRFPKTLASVGPEQFSGTGTSNDIAQTNALKLAAEKAAQDLVSQVNAANIH